MSRGLRGCSGFRLDYRFFKNSLKIDLDRSEGVYGLLIMFQRVVAVLYVLAFEWLHCVTAGLL